MIGPVFRNVRFLPGTINTGFPSPASEYEGKELDINELVVPHPTSSYFMRVSGDSRTAAYIYDDDILVVDQAITWAEVYGDEGSNMARKRSFACALDDKHPTLSMLKLGHSR